MKGAERLTAPSWSCVHFSDSAPDPDPLTVQGIVVGQCDASETADDKDLLDLIGEALTFPAYFGRNWDALDEMLRDLEWLPADGWVLVVEGARHLWTTRPENAANLVRGWLGAAERWARDERPFHLVFVW
jgi:hypothetical protein